MGFQQMGKKFGNVPYGNATAGDNAREEIIGLLRKMGASHVGFMTDFDNGEVQLQFRYRNQNVMLKASAGGWAALALEKNPHNNHMITNKGVTLVEHLQGDRNLRNQLLPHLGDPSE